MDDENDWLSADSKKPNEDDNEPAADQAPAAEPVEAEHEGDYLDPDKLLLFKHWIRPRFVPYKYLTDYRKNYYDDILDYLDKRTRGISRDIPVSQTWGERALRTYNQYSNRIATWKIQLEDKKLVEESRFSGKFHLQHAKNYINRRYYSIV